MLIRTGLTPPAASDICSLINQDMEDSGMTTETARTGRPVVLLSQARSGTNFLISRLQATRQILFGWEPFNQTFLGYGGYEFFNVPPEVRDRMNDVRFRDSDPDGYVTYCGGFTGALGGTGVRLSGFKIFPSHNADRYWKMTRDTRFRALVLERRSVLAVYSSLQIALQTREWVANPKAGERDQVRVQFDPKGFETFAAQYRGDFARTEENLRAASVDFLKISYEDLVADPQVFERILGFLDLDPPREPGIDMKKQNDSNVLKRFLNPEDARPYLEREHEEQRRFA